MKKEETKTLINTWADLNNIVGASDKKNGATISMYANLFGVPFWGITMLSDKPYINTLGLEWKHKQHPEALKILGCEMMVLHNGQEETNVAICRAWGEDERGNISVSFGSASRANMNRMVQAYPNELAETRAKNRLLRRALLPHIYKDFMENVKTMGEEAYTLLSTGKILDAVSVSAEEINFDDDLLAEPPKVILTMAETEEIKPFLQSITDAKTMEKLTPILEEIKKSALKENQKKKLGEVYANKVKMLTEI